MLPACSATAAGGHSEASDYRLAGGDDQLLRFDLYRDLLQHRLLNVLRAVGCFWICWCTKQGLDLLAQEL